MNNEPSFTPPEKPIETAEVDAEVTSDNEPTNKTTRTRPAVAAFEILEMFVWSVFAVLLIFTFCFRICRVEGSSMEHTLSNGEALLLSEAFYTPKQDDIIVFHLTNEDTSLEKTMVKRVIATSGQKIRIDFNTGMITIDGEVYKDSHKFLMDYYGHKTDSYDQRLDADHHYNKSTRIFEATVPEGHVFVMGDNRNNSKDSRKAEVGFVDERSILGKVILRLVPFTILT